MVKKLLYIFFILIIFTPDVYGHTSEETLVNGYFYYYNPCESCNEQENFHYIVNKQLKELPKNINYSFVTRNVFKDSIYESYSSLCDRLGVPQEQRNMPLLVVNDRYAVGYDDIRDNVLNMVLDATSDTGSKLPGIPESSTHVYDVKQQMPTHHITKDESHLVYFFTLSCSSCEKAKRFLDKLDKTFLIDIDGKIIKSTVTIEPYNIIDDYEKIRIYFDEYNVPKEDRQVPIVFYSHGYLSGHEEIVTRLSEVIAHGDALNFSYPQQQFSTKGVKATDLTAVALTGLINGLNPCSASMLFLLLSLVVAQNVSVIRLGLSYVFGKVVAYFAIGCFFFSFFSFLDSKIFFAVQRGLNTVLVIASVTFALLNFLDFLSAKSERYNKIRLQLPEAFRRFNHRLIKKAFIPKHSKYMIFVVFLLGIFISAGEFLCTGQIFVATIIYLVKTSSSYSLITFFTFALYIFMMTVPCLFLIFAVDKSKRTYIVSEWMRKNMPVIKLTNFILFTVFAAIILISSF